MIPLLSPDLLCCTLQSMMIKWTVELHFEDNGYPSIIWDMHKQMIVRKIFSFYQIGLFFLVFSNILKFVVCGFTLFIMATAHRSIDSLLCGVVNLEPSIFPSWVGLGCISWNGWMNKCALLGCVVFFPFLLFDSLSLCRWKDCLLLSLSFDGLDALLFLYFLYF